MSSYHAHTRNNNKVDFDDFMNFDFVTHSHLNQIPNASSQRITNSNPYHHYHQHSSVSPIGVGLPPLNHIACSGTVSGGSATVATTNGGNTTDTCESSVASCSNYDLSRTPSCEAFAMYAMASNMTAPVATSNSATGSSGYSNNIVMMGPAPPATLAPMNAIVHSPNCITNLMTASGSISGHPFNSKHPITDSMSTYNNSGGSSSSGSGALRPSSHRKNSTGCSCTYSHQTHHAQSHVPYQNVAPTAQQQQHHYMQHHPRQPIPPTMSAFPPYVMHGSDSSRTSGGSSAAASIKPTKPIPRHQLVELGVLLPNGLYVNMCVYDDSTLKEIKRDLWLKYTSVMKDVSAAVASGSRARVRLAAKQLYAETALSQINAARGSISEPFASSFSTANSPLLPISSNTVTSTSTHVIIHTEEELKGKKTKKRRLSFKRSPSLNLSKLNFWSDKNTSQSMSFDTTYQQSDSYAMMDDGTESKSVATTSTSTPPPLTRSLSMRKKMIGTLVNKFRRSNSVRSGSISTPHVSSTTESAALCSSLSTPTSPMDPSPSAFLLPSTSSTATSFTQSTPTTLVPTSDPNNNKDLPSPQPESSTKTPLTLETTASMVLANFDNLNTEKEFPIRANSLQPASKLMALTTEDYSDYVFTGVTNEAKVEEFMDDSQRLIDLNLFMPMLKLVEAIGNKKEKLMNHIISSIISKPLNELDSETSTEFCQFRANMHSTMVATVTERESLSVDERIFYEFPPELDDIDTLQLSTKKMITDLDNFEAMYKKGGDSSSGSMESLFSFPSYDSLDEIMIESSGSTADNKKEKNYHRKVSLTDGTSDSDRNSNKPKERPPPPPEMTNQTEADDKPVYTEVVALKNPANRGNQLKRERIPPTEYPMVLVHPNIGPGGVQPSNEPKKDSAPEKSKKKLSKKKMKKVKKKKDQPEVNLAGRMPKLAKSSPQSKDSEEDEELDDTNTKNLSSKSSTTTSTQLSTESQQPKNSTTADYEDHYEMCFDNPSSSSAASGTFRSASKPGRIDFCIWTSLATFLHGACHGDIVASGFEDLIVIYDEIANAEIAAKSAKNVTFSPDLEYKNVSSASSEKAPKPKKRSLFRNLFRKSKQLNVIQEVTSDVSHDSNNTAQQQTAQQSLMSSSSSAPSSLSSIVSSSQGNSGIDQSSSPSQQPSPTEPDSGSTTNSINTSSSSVNQAVVMKPSSLLIRSTSQVPASTAPTFRPNNISAKYDSRPHLLPQMFQLKCRPESTLPRDLISKLLKLYLVWLRRGLQDRLQKLQEAAANAPAASTSAGSSNSTGSSFSKTITKLLNPKSPSTQTSPSPTRSSSASRSPSVAEAELPDAYVEMILCPGGPSIESSSKTTSQQSSSTATSSSPSSPLSSLSPTTNASPTSSSHNSSPPSTPNANDEVSRIMAILDKLDQNKINFDASRYLLKICGYEQYLIGDYSTNCFEYIRNRVSKGKTPQLMLISKLAIIDKIPNYLYVMPSFLRRLTNHPNLAINNLQNFHMSKFSSQAKQMIISGLSVNNTKTMTTSSDINRHFGRRLSLQHPDAMTSPKGSNGTKQTTIEPVQTETNYAVICSKQTMNQRKLRKRSKSSCSDSLKNSTQNSQESLEPQITEYLDGSAELVPLAKKGLGVNCASTDSAATCNTVQSVYNSICGDDTQSLDEWIEKGITKQSLISLWKINTVFRVKILLAQYINVKDVDKIYVQAGIYHGSEPLCSHQSTKHVEPQNPRWDEMLEFPELCIQDLPLSSRMSIALCAIRKKPHEEFATAWINLQLFNYRRCMLSGKISLSLWPMHKGFEGFLNPHGPSGSNPNRFTSPRLQIEFDAFPKPVVYPHKSYIEEYAAVVNRQEFQFRDMLKQMIKNKEPLPAMIKSRSQIINSGNNNLRFNAESNIECLQLFENCSINRFVRTTGSNQWILKQLRRATMRLDPFAELSEQEKDFFWRERLIIKRAVPDSLPKVLESVRWACREEVCQMYALLDEWPRVSVDTAIILLGARYIDTLVREFAVRSLDYGLTDGLMTNYLIQLIQLLKNEPHHDSALARLLLRRALLNRRFGHQFFWQLHSQIQDPSCSLRWCVMLEMYCRGLSQTALRITLAQVEALDEIERIGNTTAQESDQREAIVKLLSRPDIVSKVNRFYNPLNIAIPLNDLIKEKLRVMDSAKKPLWLEWSNPDPYAIHNGLDVSAVIFKSGDDLRQDMLTLQVIRIMDLIWRRENLDLKMLPYNCIATGDNVGMIEVVRHAKTVMGIQRSGGRMAALQVDNSKLHKWIKDHNLSTYDNAVDNFTRSCAGYCVATFILGIGDRNPDNIMVNEDGQIFHIDFGHFLGHFKKKFGINRERVPFVLTYDFLQVISKGSENPLKSKEFEAFQRLCYDAYLALHDNAHLLISLFIMMLGTGIPELQTIDDVQYLRQTLQVDKSREEALQYFETQLDEAHGGAWSTKLDWFFHSVKHA